MVNCGDHFRTNSLEEHGLIFLGKGVFSEWYLHGQFANLKVSPVRYMPRNS